MAKPSLADAIHQAAREAIIWGDLAPGTPISEGELAASHGTSKTPARQALARLCDEGLVNLIPYRGYYVAPMGLRDAKELYETRLILELGVIDLAVRNAPEGAARDLELAAAGGERSDARAYLLANAAFHLGIARLGGNARLEGLLRECLDLMRRPMALDSRLGLDKAAQIAEHVEIARCIARRDAVGATARMREHIVSAGERFLRLLPV